MTQPPVHHSPTPPPHPSSGSGYIGLIIGIVVGAVALLTVAAVGAWFVLGGGGSDRGATAGPSSPAASSADDRPRVGDGAPASEVLIESVTMTKPPSAKKDAEKCDYKQVDGPAPTDDLEDVGSPKDGDKPASGTQDMTVTTNHGELVVEVDNAKAPCTAASFDFLAGKKFFDDGNCHRLTTKDMYVLQCGDPSGTGRGGPTYQFTNEYTPEDTASDLTESEIAAGETPKPNYRAGDVAMANSGGTDTNGSQFFFVYKDTYLPPSYTVFGTLTSGMDVIEAIADNGAVTPQP